LRGKLSPVSLKHASDRFARIGVLDSFHNRCIGSERR
jgi:hypothetical protein